MFDVGFSELVLLGIVALVVIGPERLPQAIRTATLWVNQIRRSINTMKAEIESQVGADEIRRQLRNEDIMKELKASRDQLNGLVKDTRSTLQEVGNSTKELTRLPPEPTQKEEQHQQQRSGN